MRKHLDTTGSTIDIIIDSIIVIAYPVQYENLKLKIGTIINSTHNIDRPIKNSEIVKSEFATLDDLNFYI